MPDKGESNTDPASLNATPPSKPPLENNTSNSVFLKTLYEVITPQQAIATVSITITMLFLVVVFVAGAYYLGELIFLPFIGTAVLAIGGFILGSTTGGVDTDDRRPVLDYPEFKSLVTSLTATMNVRTPKIVVYTAPYAHAKIIPLVFQRHDSLYITTTMLSSFSHIQTTAIIAHELSHLKNLDHHFRPYSAITEATSVFTGILIMGAACGGVLGVTPIPQYPYHGHGVMIQGLTFFVGIAVWLGGHTVAGQYRQTSEFLADRTAASYVSPAALKEALIDLQPGNRINPVPDLYRSLISDYPPLRDRLTVLELTNTD